MNNCSARKVVGRLRWLSIVFLLFCGPPVFAENNLEAKITETEDVQNYIKTFIATTKIPYSAQVSSDKLCITLYGDAGFQATITKAVKKLNSQDIATTLQAKKLRDEFQPGQACNISILTKISKSVASKTTANSTVKERPADYDLTSTQKQISDLVDSNKKQLYYLIALSVEVAVVAACMTGGYIVIFNRLEKLRPVLIVIDTVQSRIQATRPPTSLRSKVDVKKETLEMIDYLFSELQKLDELSDAVTEMRSSADRKTASTVAVPLPPAHNRIDKMEGDLSSLQTLAYRMQAHLNRINSRLKLPALNEPADGSEVLRRATADPTLVVVDPPRRIADQPPDDVNGDVGQADAPVVRMLAPETRGGSEVGQITNRSDTPTVMEIVASFNALLNKETGSSEQIEAFERRYKVLPLDQKIRNGDYMWFIPYLSIAGSSERRHGYVVPAKRCIYNWATQFKKEGGKLAEELLGEFFSLSAGTNLELIRPARFLEINGTFSFEDKGELLGI